MSDSSVAIRLFKLRMDDSELEEGEACEYTLDPDAYSYIDEKIENCLGHLQKEFVGGELSAEHLGAKFGGYGSFLPAHRRSPSVLSQARSPTKPPNQRNSAASPCNPPLEGTHHNRSVVTGTSISWRNIPKRVPSTNNLAKKETLASGPSSRQLPTQKHNPSKNYVDGGNTDLKASLCLTIQTCEAMLYEVNAGDFLLTNHEIQFSSSVHQQFKSVDVDFVAGSSEGTKVFDRSVNEIVNCSSSINLPPPAKSDTAKKTYY